jgi:hypothetical protein
MQWCCVIGAMYNIEVGLRCGPLAFAPRHSVVFGWSDLALITTRDIARCRARFFLLRRHTYLPTISWHGLIVACCVQATDLTRSLQDGRLLCAIISLYHPTLLPYKLVSQVAPRAAQ